MQVCTQNPTQRHQAESAYDYIQSLGAHTIQKFGSPTVVTVQYHATTIESPPTCVRVYPHIAPSMIRGIRGDLSHSSAPRDGAFCHMCLAIPTYPCACT